MKKTSLLFVLLFFFASLSQAQLLSERTDGKVIIGGDFFTDFSTGAAYEICVLIAEYFLAAVVDLQQ